jgi:hypothetical protein
MIYSAITKIQKFARGVIVRKRWNDLGDEGGIGGL